MKKIYHEIYNILPQMDCIDDYKDLPFRYTKKQKQLVTWLMILALIVISFKIIF